MEQLNLLNSLAVESPGFGVNHLELTDRGLLALKENLFIDSIRSALGLSVKGIHRRPSEEAWQWIFSDENESPFSFENCCAAIPVDPQRMRELLMIESNFLG